MIGTGANRREAPQLFERFEAIAALSQAQHPEPLTADQVEELLAEELCILPRKGAPQLIAQADGSTSESMAASWWISTMSARIWPRQGRPSQAVAPGQAAREDYEYERNGVAAIFCAVAPHLGWRRMEERERKTRVDYAAFLRTLADEDFPEAARLKARFEFHFTPKHGSWLNNAELELSALGRGCLARRSLSPRKFC